MQTYIEHNEILCQLRISNDINLHVVGLCDLQWIQTDKEAACQLHKEGKDLKVKARSSVTTILPLTTVQVFTTKGLTADIHSSQVCHIREGCIQYNFSSPSFLLKITIETLSPCLWGLWCSCRMSSSSSRRSAIIKQFFFFLGSVLSCGGSELFVSWSILQSSVLSLSLSF